MISHEEDLITDVFLCEIIFYLKFERNTDLR